ncbi:aminotransferase class I/II-fold pyridoxal phosphate-dependent enzyme [Chryseobacterium sp.]|uniref:aminotransferase class I/II-fold pyridoxal phosphate-dependent enzyme n=1 Tax=Chryseobacterium sp. TaxID=1871047 RepID=UPI0038908E67
MQNKYQFHNYSYFTEMSALATLHQSYDLALGLPNFDIDSRLKYFLKEAVDQNTHSYESLAGNILLIDNIIKYNAARYFPILLTQDEVNIVPCSTFALYTTLQTILNLGDEVIVIQPCYYTYAPSIVINGGIPIYCELDNDFTILWDLLKNCITEKTKAIIINSPQNPTGKMWSAKDWNTLYELIKEQEIYIISEEIYDIYCYDDREHYSAFCHPELKKRTFSIFSFGKMFHATGWKVSYLLSTKQLLEAFRSKQQYISYSSNAPCQYAIAKYLEEFNPSVSNLQMQKKRDLFCEMLSDTPLLVEKKTEGSFYQLVNFESYSKNLSDVDFSKWLTVEKKVSCLPLSAFYQNKKTTNYIRFSFAKSDELIIQALDHLKKVL